MQGLCNAAVLAAALLRAVSAQPPVSVAPVSFFSAQASLNTTGAQASLNTTGNATSFTTITVNGRTNTIGAMSMRGGNASSFIDIDATRGPPVETDISVRLVEGGAEPGGAWEYGRLEIFRGGIWNIVEERRIINEVIGTREVQVLCRTLGFATGAQLLGGVSSPFPAPQSSIVFDARIRCNGMETKLADCDINNIDYASYDYYDYGGLRTTAVALICTTPSGCGGPPAQPAEGDVRLVPLNGTTTPTASCDDVHIGSVELFRGGRWGSICAGSFGDEEEDAQVVCRQLGFPFGTVVDGADTVFNFDYSAPEGVIWATQVVCTGKEERLLDCNFPENFEDVDYSFRYDYNENLPAPPHAAPAPAPEATAPPPSGLVNSRCDRNARDRLSVVCTRFEITESDFIRR